MQWGIGVGEESPEFEVRASNYKSQHTTLQLSKASLPSRQINLPPSPSHHTVHSMHTELRLPQSTRSLAILAPRMHCVHVRPLAFLRTANWELKSSLGR